MVMNPSSKRLFMESFFERNDVVSRNASRKRRLKQRKAQLISKFKEEARKAGRKAMCDDTIYKHVRDKEKFTAAKCTGGNCYICADGLENLQALAHLVQDIAVESVRDALLMRIADLRFFLLYSFQANHLAQSSNIATHCLTFALSHPTEEKLQTSCTYDHFMSCVECNERFLILEDVDSIISSLPDSPRKSDLTVRLKEVTEGVNLFVGHLMRETHQRSALQNRVAALKPGHAYVIYDYMMKWLPKRKRATSRQHYGQKGLSVHIAMYIYRERESDH
eukprot:Lithocolla_globosa_v1_NODE_13_length_10672_cov_64.188000.p3 type:complete len:278 gc:universal NODE_13_length_10672_cov_64.188000:898-65(-)